ncbi:dCTP deaminase domain-containing protein [Cellulomonas marina]|uniref:dCTP deaminase domain-containing protein n=1 Tax=Cellulomonas marina TaxID=988821 RepID=UPI000B7EFAD5|nr:hypothetical protein [Cellulomonas marina]
MTIVAIPHRITDSTVDFDAARMSPESLILAVRHASGDRNKVAAEEFELNLTFGNRWADDLSEQPPRFYSIDGDELTIPPRSSVIVESAEEIGLPNNLFGLILPKGTLFQAQGVYPLQAKIDPRWRGRLWLLIINSSNERRVIKRGQALAAVLFLETNRTVRGSEELRDSVPAPNRPATTRQRVLRRLSSIPVPLWAAAISAATTLLVNLLAN